MMTTEDEISEVNGIQKLTVKVCRDMFLGPAGPLERSMIGITLILPAMAKRPGIPSYTPDGDETGVNRD